MDISTPGTDGAGLHVSFRTICGRQIRVGHLVLGGSRHPAQRVSLDIGASSRSDTGTWAGLTAGEARRLAAALLRQAAACDTPPAARLREAPAAEARSEPPARYVRLFRGRYTAFPRGQRP